MNKGENSPSPSSENLAIMNYVLLRKPILFRIDQYLPWDLEVNGMNSLILL
jgi:hypothetical protein